MFPLLLDFLVSVVSIINENDKKIHSEHKKFYFLEILHCFPLLLFNPLKTKRRLL